MLQVRTLGQPNVTNVTSQAFYGNTGKYIAAEGFIYDTFGLE
jgi:hypothetical protein